MTTKEIKSGDTSFVLKSVKPFGWNHGATITVDLIALDGTVLESNNAVTVYSGGVLGSGADAGEYDVILAVDNAITAGSRVAIGSSASGYQDLVVDNYDSSTKTITFTQCLDEPVSTSDSVYGLDLSSTVDFSDSKYDGLKKITVKWKSDSDDLPMSEEWRILTKSNQPSGLVIDFQRAYPSIASTVPDEAINTLIDRAEQWLINYCNTKNRDYKLVQDNEITKELMLNKMALMQGTTADISEQYYERIQKQFDDNMIMFDSLPIWIDTNEDDIKTEDETQTADASAPISRGL